MDESSKMHYCFFINLISVSLILCSVITTLPPPGRGDAPNPLMINRPPLPLATGLSYVQVRVCLICVVESVLCAVSSLCYVLSLVSIMCCL